MAQAHCWLIFTLILSECTQIHQIKACSDSNYPPGSYST